MTHQPSPRAEPNNRPAGPPVQGLHVVDPGQLALRATGHCQGRAVTTECSIWLRNVVKITDPNKPFYSHRHTATSYLRNTRLPDGSPAVKEDIECYILGHAGKGAHAGYAKR
jgi:hypothetical protein